jgi:ferredoxin-NADP reductase
MSNPQKIKVKVNSVNNHSTGVFTVVFKAEQSLPRYKSGQFLHLALDEFDPSSGFWPDSRVFSIALTPSNTEIQITYSVKGAFTARMEKELAVGKEIWLKFPYGAFIIDDVIGIDSPAILVAGGTGITPFVSFLDKEAIQKSERTIVLFYGVRHPSLLIYDEQIKKIENECKNFRLSLYVEEDTPQGAKTGRLNASAIIDSYQEISNVSIFLAGPPKMMDHFRNEFLTAGIPSKNIVKDEWE